jgi:hypothetical protein
MGAALQNRSGVQGSPVTNVTRVTIASDQQRQISPYFFRRFPQVIRIVHSFCTSGRGFPIADNFGLPQSVGSENVRAS